MHWMYFFNVTGHPHPGSDGSNRRGLMTYAVACLWAGICRMWKDSLDSCSYNNNVY